MILTEKITALETECGGVDYDGKRYTLLQDAYSESPTYGPQEYRSLAICKDDPMDEYGYMPVYEVTWDVLEEYIAEDGSIDFEAANCDESNLCDWESPSDVQPTGYGYNPSTGRMG